MQMIYMALQPQPLDHQTSSSYLLTNEERRQHLDDRSKQTQSRTYHTIDSVEHYILHSQYCLDIYIQYLYHDIKIKQMNYCHPQNHYQTQSTHI